MKFGVKVLGHPSTVVLAPGEPIVGAVVSRTVTLCCTWALLPHASTALHVLVNVRRQVVSPVLLSVNVGVIVPAHASDAVGAVKLGLNVCGHPSMVVFPPWPPIEGGVVSTVVVVLLQTIGPPVHV